MSTVIESVAAVGARGRRRAALALADAASRRALDRAGLTAADVDLLVNAGIYHERTLGEPALAALIQEDIGANPEDPHAGGHGTFSFDLANGSCGMLSGLQVADGFLRAGTIRHALVLASDADPGRRMAPGFPFGRTGAAIVVGWRAGDAGIQAFRFAAAPDGGDRAADGLRATVSFVHGRNTLEIEQEPGFARAAGAWAAKVAGEVLGDAGLGPHDVDLVVANPLVPEVLDELAAGLGVDRHRFVDTAAGRAAHTAGLGVALDAVDGGLPAGTTLLVSAGAGPIAGAALVRA
jgi:3-oxoacyl-[acyl-carrier-protein] synthase-3